MDVNHSCCSSEQSASQQLQQGETGDLLTLQKHEVDTEVVVQSDSQGDKNVHSMKMGDSDNCSTAIESNSPAAHQSSPPVCGGDKVTEEKGNQCEEDSSRNGVNDSQRWCDPSMLLDNSVEEFSISSVVKDNEEVKEVNIDETNSGRENIPVHTHEKESDLLTHSQVSNDEAEPYLAEQTKGKQNAPPAGTESQANSNLQNEINNLLSATSPLCSPSLELEVGRVDFSTTPKENLMRMVSDLLDECDWLKKEKAR